MKIASIILLIVVITINTDCSQSSKDMLAGKWKFADDYECPDFIQLNTDGKYIIFNDCGSQNPGLPIVEKGSWDFKENEIILYNREFVSKNSVFAEYHGTGGKLCFKIKEVSANKLTLCFVNSKSDCKTEKYTRVENYIEIDKTYSGTNQSIEEILISKRKYTSITLSYDFFKVPDQLYIEDHVGNILYCTNMEGTNGEVVKEIYLGNKNNIEKLVFRIKSEKPNSNWRFRVKIK